MIVNTLPEPTKIICLTEARNRYRADKCQHKHMTVDEELNEVECSECGAKLNPVAMLLRFASEESRWAREAESMRKLKAELDQRIRCKCQHCGQMTRIRV